MNANPNNPTLALSIRQPWAWLILNAGKDVENRSWPTHIRGRVWIHAGKKFTSQEFDDAMEFWSQCVGGSIAAPKESDLLCGGIVGSIEIADCLSPGRLSDDSKWYTGDYGFVLRNPIVLPFRACRGSLGFFKPQFS